MLKTEDTYKNDKKEGFYKTYYKNGNLCSEGAYKDNKEEGIYKKYYENGDLYLYGFYKNGRLEKPFYQRIMNRQGN